MSVITRVPPGVPGRQRQEAVSLMNAALAMLDTVGPSRAAATLSLAIEQAGGVALEPRQPGRP